MTLLPLSLSLISLPLLPLPLQLGLPLLGQPGPNFAALLLSKGELAALGPAIGGVAASATAFQNVLNALDEGPEDIANALINGPALVTNAVLNGSFLPPGIPFPGILTPGNPLDPGGFPGPLAFTVGLGKLLGVLAPQPESFSTLSVPGGESVETFRGTNPGVQPQGALPGGSGPVVEKKKLPAEEPGNAIDAEKVKSDEGAGKTTVLDCSAEIPRARSAGRASRTCAKGSKAASRRRSAASIRPSSASLAKARMTTTVALPPPTTPVTTSSTLALKNGPLGLRRGPILVNR